MCFGKTKTVKSQKEKNILARQNELGFNIEDNCDYIDHDHFETMKPKSSGLRIVQINCRGTKSELDDLDDFLSSLKYPDVIIISETWLKQGESMYIDIKGYKFKGIHREYKKGGGVGFLIKEGIIYKPRLDLIKGSQYKL